MRRSTEFDATVKHGVRTVQPDVVVYVRRENDVYGQGAAPRVGLIIAKSVGSAVERHRVARRLRHVTRNFLSELGGSERVVIRALPSSRTVSSARLAQEVRRGLGCALASAGMKS